jgi:hypothetical protein
VFMFMFMFMFMFFFSFSLLPEFRLMQGVCDEIVRL